MHSTESNTCHIQTAVFIQCQTVINNKFLCSSNPMGHKGVVAKEFAWLMRNMWSGRYKSVTPRDFKAMVDRFIPHMQGHSQQDAQEFLAFLMNELHEDLNRVTNCEYISEPDSNEMDDRKLASIAWKNHLKRNSSVIVEHFQGIYRSTVICNYCRKRSTTFEPFMYLSLPIPPGHGPCTLKVSASIVGNFLCGKIFVV